MAAAMAVPATPAAPPATAARDESLFRRGLRVVWRYARRQPKVFALSIVGATAYSAALVATTAILGRITDELILPAFEPGGGGVTDRAALGGFVALLAMGLLRSASIVLRRYSAGVLTMRTAADLRRRVSGTLLDVPLDYHRSKPTGELLAHADADVIAATEVLNPVPFSIGVAVLILFSVVSLLAIDPLMALVALVLFPALALVNQVYTDRVHRPVATVAARVGDVSRLAHESFDGALVVKVLGLADEETARMRTAADRLRDARIGVGRIRAVFEPAIGALPNLGIVVLLGVGAWAIDAGRIRTGELVTALALFGILALPVRIVGFFLQELPRAVVATGRIDRVLDAPPGRRPGVGLPLPDGPLPVSVEGLASTYPDGTEALRDVSFSLEPGEVVALVGGTGAGKSTLCELLVGLSEPTRGTLRVGGVATTEVDPAALRGAVALVFQEPFLFADALRDNIVVDDGSDATDRVAAAIRVARADEFVADLSAGLDTVVGERGVTLSGGQRQRIALARALARRPRVLVLDDATSAVDPVVEAEILAGLRRTLDATTLVVAHRLNTIRLADRVLFLDEGRIVATGTHEELLAVPAYERILRAYEDR